MRLATFRVQDVVRFGAFDDGRYIALDGCGEPFLEGARTFLAAGAAALQRAEALLRSEGRAGLPSWPQGSVELLPPVPDPRKVICVGRNYRAHCMEQGREVPESPVIFTKFAASLAAHGQAVVIPPESSQVDFEVELAVVIGPECRRIPPEEAFAHVGGYAVFNDVTARDVQAEDGQWTRAKSFATFGPFGPHLVTPDEVPNPHDLRISLEIGGQAMQDSNTAQMVVRIPELLSFLSRIVPLEPGDVVATGTPHGVGGFRNPPVFLAPGDVMRARIEDVGVLENRVEADPVLGPRLA